MVAHIPLDLELSASILKPVKSDPVLPTASTATIPSSKGAVLPADVITRKCLPPQTCYIFDIIQRL